MRSPTSEARRHAVWNGGTEPSHDALSELVSELFGTIRILSTV